MAFGGGGGGFGQAPPQSQFGQALASPFGSATNAGATNAGASGNFGATGGGGAFGGGAAGGATGGGAFGQPQQTPQQGAGGGQFGQPQQGSGARLTALVFFFVFERSIFARENRFRIRFAMESTTIPKSDLTRMLFFSSLDANKPFGSQS